MSAVCKVCCFLLLLALAACSGLEQKKDYEYQSGLGSRLISVGQQGDECVLNLEDRISEDLVRAFKAAAEDMASRQCATKWVALSSRGGIVESSYEIGKIIRKNGFNTRLSGVGGLCASSCGMLFIAGVKREARDSAVVGAHFGFHQMSLVSTGACVRPSAKQYVALKKYASGMLSAEGSALFVKLVSGTDCNSLETTITFKQLKDAGIITHELGEN